MRVISHRSTTPVLLLCALWSWCPEQQLRAESAPLRLAKIIGDSRGAGMDNRCVTTTRDGRIFLLMNSDRIVVFDAKGTYLRTERSPRPVRWPCYDTYLSGGKSRVFVGEQRADYAWVFDGPRGPAQGEFADPGDVFIDKSRLVYVADTGNQRVQVFDLTKHDKPLAVIPVSGSPQCVAAHADRIAVATREGTLVLAQKQDGTSQQLATLAIGTGARDLCFTPEGDVLVCFSGGWDNHDLKRYQYAEGRLNLCGVVARSFRTQWPNFYPSPVGMMPGPKNQTILFTATEEGQVLSLEVATDAIKERVTGAPRPLAATFDETGALYVGCQLNEGISPAGQVVYTYPPGADQQDKAIPLPRTGGISHEFNGSMPWGLLSASGGGAFVRVVEGSDWTSFKLKKVYPDGHTTDWLDLGKNLFAKVKRFAPWEGYYALKRDHAGDFLVAANVIASVLKVRSDGTIAWQAGRQPAGTGEDIDFGCPRDLTVDHAGRIWIADSEKHCIYCLDGQGRLLFKYGKQGNVDDREGEHFDTPTGVEVGHDGQGHEFLYVGDSGNQRILKYLIEG